MLRLRAHHIQPSAGNPEEQPNVAGAGQVRGEPMSRHYKCEDDCMQGKVSVLFVCLGNICRSPTAEAVFRAKVEEAGLSDRIEIASCGLGSWNLGQRPHPETRRVLDAHGISYDGIRAELIDPVRAKEFTYIVAMDHSNLEGLARLDIDEGRVHLLTDFIPGREGEEVPDPYYYGNFEGVYDLIEEGVLGLLDHIKDAHDLD